MVLLNHVVQVLALPHAATTTHRPVLFQLLDCDRIGRVLSTLMTRGGTLAEVRNSLRKKRLAEAASRFAVSRKSMVCPVESTARYRYRSWPLTLSRVGGGAQPDGHASLRPPLSRVEDWRRCTVGPAYPFSSPFPLRVPHYPGREPVSSPRHVKPSVRISRTGLSCLLPVKGYGTYRASWTF